MNIFLSELIVNMILTVSIVVNKAIILLVLLLNYYYADEPHNPLYRILQSSLKGS